MKQETLEEVALKYASEKLDRLIIPYKELNANVAEYVGFINGAKWQEKRMYSEEEVEQIVLEALQSALVTVDIKQWFKQFKKK